MDVVLKVALPDDSWALHILVPASPTQHRSMSGLCRYYENIAVVHDPIECTDWLGYRVVQAWKSSAPKATFFRRYDDRFKSASNIPVPPTTPPAAPSDVAAAARAAEGEMAAAPTAVAAAAPVADGEVVRVSEGAVDAADDVVEPFVPPACAIDEEAVPATTLQDRAGLPEVGGPAVHLKDRAGLPDGGVRLSNLDVPLRGVTSPLRP